MVGGSAVLALLPTAIKLMGICFIVFNLLLTSSFVQKWYFPQGINYGGGIVCIGDTDQDGNFEFIFTTYGGSYTIYFYELHLPNTWEADSVSIPHAPLLWDAGDFDADGLSDLVMQYGSVSPFWVGVSIFESPDSFSYPTQEVWRDTVGFALVQPISVHDVDKDNYPEIFKLGWKKEDSVTIYYSFGIYESFGDNQYDTIFVGDSLGSLSSTTAFGDFDADSLCEFIIGSIDGHYQIWECIGNNAYQRNVYQQIPIPSGIKDCFTVFDSDGDGRLEFVLKGHVLSIAEVNTYIFEATGDNTYEIIKSFILPGGSFDYYDGYSDAGDVDGDSVPEIVLEACQYVYVIKSAGNDSFYVWDTLPGNWTGSNVRVTDDIDGNGLNEIVISGGNTTRIYEYEPGGIEEGWFGDVPLRTQFGVIAPNPFTGAVRISYQVAAAGEVKLSVYDAAGRLVYRLADGVHQPGYYQLIWKGIDDLGGRTPAGVYFVRMEAGGNKEMSKIIMVK